MILNTTLQLAFVLHARPYKDSSLLIELFTQEKGKITAIAKGARRPNSAFKNALQLFQPILVTWVGKFDLVTLTQAEIYQFLPLLMGERCWCGLYLNELLMYLIEKRDPYPVLFQLYYQTLLGFMQPMQLENSLRYFEKSFLSEIGYGLELNRDNRGEPINKNAIYQFVRGKHTQHFQKIEHENQTSKSTLYAGRSLLALHESKLDENTAKDAKRLLRQALLPLLGNKPLRSREMFQALQN